MKFSIVIPTHSRHSSLLNLLRSIKDQAYDLNSVETIVVSNLADSFFKGTEFKGVAEHLNCRVLVAGRKSVNRARNLGLAESVGEIVLLLDDDCVLFRSHYLSELEQLHKTHPHVLAIGGTYALGPEASPLDKAYNCVAKQWQSLDHFGDYRSSRLVGGNVSYKRLELLETGEVFDENIDFGGTEAEFHQRLNKKGATTYFIPTLEVMHKTNISYQSLVRKAFLQAQGHLKYKIEEGFSDKASRTYQNKRILLARGYAPNEQDFLETVNWMNLYDWAYNYSCENPKASSKKVFSKSRSWLAKQEPQAGRVLR